MKPRTLAIVVAMFALASAASAHRLDEYLQATLLTVSTGRVDAEMRLVPGVAVAQQVLAAIDTNNDGVLSPAEQRAYAEHVLNALTLSVDGLHLTPQLTAFAFPPVDQVREGMGEITLTFTANLPPGGPHRRLTLTNDNQLARAAYLVNSLVPQDHAIHLGAQTRNPTQSFYQLDYTVGGAAATVDGAAAATAHDSFAWNGFASLGATGFISLFHLGLRHIAEGTDHLLFLLALLLPAPLLSAGNRWSGIASTRDSLSRILRMVTAFTAGHSLTLALAAMGIVRVPTRPIEVLIAVSILVSAIHALRPIFSGREAAIAAFFGLIHGLAFAATLSELGLTRGQRITGILAFNLGIETMQLLVVAATLPSLLLLSRTCAYPTLRIAGALFAFAAATGWTIERLLHLDSRIDPAVDAVAHRAPALAATLFAFSLAGWLFDRRRNNPTDNLLAEASGAATS